MVTEKTLERINELYHKSKAEGLTDAELAEQKQLRADYVKAFRENLRGQLESIKIKNPDGSLIDVKARHDEKMKRLAEEQAEKGNYRKPSGCCANASGTVVPKSPAIRVRAEPANTTATSRCDGRNATQPT